MQNKVSNFCSFIIYFMFNLRFYTTEIVYLYNSNSLIAGLAPENGHKGKTTFHIVASILIKLTNLMVICWFYLIISETVHYDDQTQEVVYLDRRMGALSSEFKTFYFYNYIIIVIIACTFNDHTRSFFRLMLLVW